MSSVGVATRPPGTRSGAARRSFARVHPARAARWRRSLAAALPLGAGGLRAGAARGQAPWGAQQASGTVVVSKDAI